ncbi:MAG: limonene-1,2-epoxide hydrolase family protein [Solirubrobacterales bacterium]
MTIQAEQIATERSTDPGKVVTDFLLALQDQDIDGAVALLDDDVAWINVSLPTVRGRRAVEKLFRLSLKIGGGFRVHFHSTIAEGDTVFNQRTDAITLGRFEQRFWVIGRFEVRDGKIVVWRDAFDWGDYLWGFVRALLGVVSPRLNRPWPTDK